MKYFSSRKKSVLQKPPSSSSFAGSLRIVRFRLASAIVGAALASVQISEASAPVFIGFEESEGYVIGSPIAEAQGWSISEEANGIITNEDRLSGQQSLRIEAGDHPVRAEYWPTDAPAQGVRFIEVNLRPIPVAEEEATTFLNLLGAEIALTRGDGNAISLHLLAGEEEDEPSGSCTFSVNAESEAFGVPWLDLVVRQDLSLGTWDLFLNGDLVAVDRTLGASTQSLEAEVGVQEALYLDGFGIGTGNPPFLQSKKWKNGSVCTLCALTNGQKETAFLRL